MGGSSSNASNKSEVKHIQTMRSFLPYEMRKKKYIEGNKQFAVNILAGPLAEELPLLEGVEASQLKAKLSSLYNKYKKDLTKAKITETVFNMRIRELYVESILKKKMLKENFEIFKFIGEQYSSLNIGTCDSKAYKDAIYIFEKEFDIKLSMVTYSLLTFSNLQIEEIFALNRHINFNITYQPNVFNVILNEKLLSNKDIIDDLCDLIGNCKSIKILTLLLYPKEEQNLNLPENFGLTCATYKSLFSIMKAVNRNKNIKGLFLHCVKDYDISLAPEIFDKIFKNFKLRL